MAEAPRSGLEQMFYEVGQFPELLLGAVDSGIKVDVKQDDFDSILLCGMGGSGIACDIIADCVAQELTKPLAVQKFPELPAWVGPRTFVAVSSYSGNTKETLAMYRQAVDRGCPLAVMTAGGELEQLASARHDSLICYGTGIQPRSALPAGMADLAVFMDTVCGTHVAADLRRAVPDLRRLVRRFSAPDGLAATVARSIAGRAPIIYSASDLTASALRWKGQMNENAKMVAFAGSIPDFNHNEISGWSRRSLSEKCVPIFLYEEDMAPALKEVFDSAIVTMQQYGQDVKVIRVKGRSVLQKTLYAVLLGDFVSLFLAQLNGADPMEVTVIKNLKSRQNAALAGDQGSAV